MESDFESAKRTGNELFKKGDFTGAARQYAICTTLNPNNAVAYSNLAAAELRCGRAQEALRAAETGLKCSEVPNQVYRKLQYRLNKAREELKAIDGDKAQILKPPIVEVDILPEEFRTG